MSVQAHVRVRWKGFDASQDTWESRAKMMRAVPAMVRKFELEQSRAGKKRLVGYMLFCKHYRTAAEHVVGGTGYDKDSQRTRGHVELAARGGHSYLEGRQGH